MTAFLVCAHLYAGFLGCLSQKKNFRSMTDGEKAVCCLLVLMLWPLAPAAFLLAD